MVETVSTLAKLTWIQGMMSQRCITQAQSSALYKRACEAVKVPYNVNTYSDMIEEVKSSLSTSGLEIRGLVDEESGSNLIALVNAKSDTLAQTATAYSSQEIIYIKRLIKAIFTAPDEAYCVKSMKALSESTKVKPHMTKRACEELLASLVRHDWIHKSRTGHFSLTTRTILELQGYLKNEYPDYVLECTQCMDIVTKGFACSSRDCEARFHIHCNKAAGSSPSRVCPKCKESWDPVDIGEGSEGSGRKPNPVEESDEDIEPETATQKKKAGNRKSTVSGSKASGSRRQSKGRRNADSDEEEEEEDQEDSDEEMAEASTSRKKPAAKRTSARISSGIRVAGGYNQHPAGSESDDDDED